MSHYAQGWAQRQKLDDPIAKAVLQTMCYVMRDETLLVYIGIPELEEYTEYQEVTIRKAIRRLADRGVLLDTGRKRNNVTVWRIPGYEEWLAALPSGPSKNGRASHVDATALAQVAELTKAKGGAAGSDNKPSQKREGPVNPSPPIFAAKPSHICGQAPPNMGGNLNDLNRSPEGEEPRAIPTGSRPPPGNAARRSHWRVYASNHVIGECRGLGITAYGVNQWKQLPTAVRLLMSDKVEALVDWAIDAETELVPKKHREISAHLDSAITMELRQFKPSTPAELQAGAEDPQFDDDRGPAKRGAA